MLLDVNGWIVRRWRFIKASFCARTEFEDVRWGMGTLPRFRSRALIKKRISTMSPRKRNYGLGEAGASSVVGQQPQGQGAHQSSIITQCGIGDDQIFEIGLVHHVFYQ